MELPPVTLLRAFDAAGRHGSFKLAAQLLHVTPSTISHQIADLEHYLGVALFHRQARGLKLTAEGAALLTDVSEAFERLRAATARLRVQGQPVSIRISANPFFAAEVLIPLIESFDAAFPGVSIHVSATEQLEDPRDGAVDFCVRFGSGDWPGLESHCLYPVFAVPLISTSVDTQDPARIDFNYSGSSAWQIWAQRGGEAIKTGTATRVFNSYGAAMRAVSQGLGVSIAMMPVSQPWIDQGRVQRYGNHPSVALGNLYLVCRPLTPAQTRLRDIRDWLISQFRKSAALE
jgi:LysR family transcriptional regulator, glycine cleavage system transcriptional activator